MVTVDTWPRENSKTFERKLVRVRPPLPAPFKSNPCSPRATCQLRECHLILEGDALGRSASRGSLSAAAGLGRRFWADLVLPSPGGQRLDGAQGRVELP